MQPLNDFKPTVEHVMPSKISSIRWVPQQTEDQRYFVTGSWDLRKNNVTLWNLPVDENSETDFQLEPKFIDSFHCSGDVVGMQFLEDKNLVCATDDGTLHVLDLNLDFPMLNCLKEQHCLRNLHALSGTNVSCTSMSTFNRNVLTGGEDGYMSVVAADVGKVVRSIRDPNNSSIGCVLFICPDTVIAGRRCGFIDCYDIRQDGSKPTFGVETRHENDRGLNVPSCANYFPYQNQIIAIGMENGTIIMWDMRMPHDASALCGGLDGKVNDIQFAKEGLNEMVSCDAFGQLTQWGLQNNSEYIELFIESHYPRLVERQSINCVDVNRSNIICGGDGEMIFLMDLVR